VLAAELERLTSTSVADDYGAIIGAIADTKEINPFLNRLPNPGPWEKTKMVLLLPLAVARVVLLVPICVVGSVFGLLAGVGYDPRWRAGEAGHDDKLLPSPISAVRRALQLPFRACTRLGLFVLGYALQLLVLLLLLLLLVVVLVLLLVMMLVLLLVLLLVVLLVLLLVLLTLYMQVLLDPGLGQRGGCDGGSARSAKSPLLRSVMLPPLLLLLLLVVLLLTSGSSSVEPLYFLARHGFSHVGKASIANIPVVGRLSVPFLNICIDQQGSLL